MTNSVSDLLVAGFALDLPEPEAEERVVCALCGGETTRSVSLRGVLKATASDVADIFRYQTGRVCLACAACYGETRLLTGNLFATRERGLKPESGRTWLVQRADAHQLWSERLNLK